MYYKRNSCKDTIDLLIAGGGWIGVYGLIDPSPASRVCAIVSYAELSVLPPCPNVIKIVLPPDSIGGPVWVGLNSLGIVNKVVLNM